MLKIKTLQFFDHIRQQHYFEQTGVMKSGRNKRELDTDIFPRQIIVVLTIKKTQLKDERVKLFIKDTKKSHKERQPYVIMRNEV